VKVNKNSVVCTVGAETIEELLSAQGCNWANLFLGDINMGNWLSSLGESEMMQ
jgi:hypothetical protein